MKNTGKPSEQIFDDAWRLLGKRAHVFKFTDSAEATGTNRRVTAVKAQPSDRLVTFNGETWYAEIKSTWDERNFPFSLLRPKQGAYAAGVIAAGGTYIVYVHSLVLNRWFAVPYQLIRAVKDAGRASIPWTDLTLHQWEPPTL